VGAVYRRGDLLDKRRKFAAAWATFCTTSTKAAKAGAATADNLQLSRRRAADIIGG
jgi:hypothetical protein